MWVEWAWQGGFSDWGSSHLQLHSVESLAIAGTSKWVSFPSSALSIWPLTMRCPGSGLPSMAAGLLNWEARDAHPFKARVQKVPDCIFTASSWSKQITEQGEIPLANKNGKELGIIPPAMVSNPVCPGTSKYRFPRPAQIFWLYWSRVKMSINI